MQLSYFDVAHRQRACRSFAPDPVPDAAIEQVLAAAVRAPSAENGQPWEFVVVAEPERRARIATLMRHAWERGARAFEEGRLSPALLADVDQGAVGGVAAAPVLVVVGADTRRVPEPALAASVWPAVQNLLLAATALGLGSTLTTLACGPELAAVVGLPESVRPVAVVPLGRPARPLGSSRRRPLSEVVHRDAFGTPW